MNIENDKSETPPIHKQNFLSIRKNLAFLFSLGIMLWGLFGLSNQIITIFSLYPQLTENTTHFIKDSSSQYNLLQYILFTSTSNFVATAYGLALILKPTQLVKFGHYFIGICIVFISWYVNFYIQIDPIHVINSLQ